MPMTRAASSAPQPQPATAPATVSPRIRLAPPATMPLRNTTCSGASCSMRAVTQLSRPQQAQAPTMKSAPRSTEVPGDQTSRTPAAATSAAAASKRRPRCSRKRVAARITVATSSVFSRIDAVAALVRARPATSSAGPNAPPATTAASTGFHSRGQRYPGRRAANCRRQDRQSGAQVEQARECQGAHIVGQPRGRRCRGTEQDRREEAADDASPTHGVTSVGARFGSTLRP